jgi:hypothetical protein
LGMPTAGPSESPIARRDIGPARRASVDIFDELRQTKREGTFLITWHYSGMQRHKHHSTGSSLTPSNSDSSKSSTHMHADHFSSTLGTSSG